MKNCELATPIPPRMPPFLTCAGPIQAFFAGRVIPAPNCFSSPWFVPLKNK